MEKKAKTHKFPDLFRTLRLKKAKPPRARLEELDLQVPPASATVPESVAPAQTAPEPVASEPPCQLPSSGPEPQPQPQLACCLQEQGQALDLEDLREALRSETERTISCLNDRLSVAESLRDQLLEELRQARSEKQALEALLKARDEAPKPQNVADTSLSAEVPKAETSVSSQGSGEQCTGTEKARSASPSSSHSGAVDHKGRRKARGKSKSR
eukprot:m51a1_g13351 hypothetical protein (213) ;mRNA; r:609-1646